jgi:hypothetical protein
MNKIELEIQQMAPTSKAAEKCVWSPLPGSTSCLTDISSRLIRTGWAASRPSSPRRRSRLRRRGRSLPLREKPSTLFASRGECPRKICLQTCTY